MTKPKKPAKPSSAPKRAYTRRKPLKKPTTPFALRIEKDLLATARRRAAEHDRSLGSYIRHLIKQDCIKAVPPTTPIAA
jgi:predicted HicB family RNase H-like nuclease